VYRNHLPSLFQPSFRIIYTIPIFVLRDVALRKILQANTDKIQTMRVAKFFAKGESHKPNPQPINPGLIDTFQRILNQRISPHLVEPEVQQQMILKSGGILRELIRLASRCCDKCSQRLRRELRNPGALLGSAIASMTIDQEILDLALTDLQIEFAEPMGQVDYDLLKIIYDKNTPPDAENQRFLDLLRVRRRWGWRRCMTVWDRLMRGGGSGGRRRIWNGRRRWQLPVFRRRWSWRSGLGWWRSEEGP
jgi:hypothetical protein